MDQVIQLLVYVLVFAVVGFGLWWTCVRFKLPDPAFWICGVLLLIILLLFLSSQLGVGGGSVFRLHGR